MKFKGTICITDPSYFIKYDDWCHKVDRDNCIINEEFNFTDYIWTPTGVGDWLFECGEYGNIGVDSGTYGVFYLDEIIQYNQSDNWINIDRVNHKLIRIFENYEGEITVVEDESDLLSLKSVGTHEFTTSW